MHRMPKFCEKCEQKILWVSKGTKCPHKMQATTVEKAKNLVAHKGPWPCTFSPIRADFVRLNNPKRKRQFHKGLGLYI
jgi:hypothetical protein